MSIILPIQVVTYKFDHILWGQYSLVYMKNFYSETNLENAKTKTVVPHVPSKAFYFSMEQQIFSVASV